MNEAPRQEAAWLRSVFYWGFPPLLCLSLYYRGLWCWFHADDFSLLLLVRLPDHEFWPALWEPRAQGTFRWLSERLFFYYFHHWFGLNAFPYRLLVFATQIVNLWLLAAVTNRLTGWKWAGFAAACAWALHHGTSTSLTWTSAYNQILCAFFFLLGFWLFLRFVSSGRLLFYWAQWVTFLLGFAALETIVVYPAVLLAYVLMFRRRYWPHAAAMFIGSAALTWFQLRAAAPAAGEPYQRYFDAGSLLEGLWQYWRWAVSAKEPVATGLLIGTPILAAVVIQAYRRNWLGAFSLGWFVITLAPYLPLRGHLSEYYLVIPGIGLAMTAAWMIERARRARASYRAALAVWLGAFLFVSIEHALRVVDFNYELSQGAKHLASEMAEARARHRNKRIVLLNVPHDLFYGAICHDIARLVEVFDVYLARDTNEAIEPVPGICSVERFLLDEADVVTGLRRDTVAAYTISGTQWVNVTRLYRQQIRMQLAPKPEPSVAQ